MKGKIKGLIVCAALAVSLPGHASAAPERHLPRREEHPHFIEIVFTSPVGEVQFTKVGGGHSGFLRNAHGNMMGFSEVSGGAQCEAWFSSNKEESLPAGCVFYFYDSYDGRTLHVRSEEMQESDLFGAASGKLRGFATAGGARNVSL